MNEGEQKVIELAWSAFEAFLSLEGPYFDTEKFQERVSDLMNCLKKVDEKRFEALVLRATQEGRCKDSR